ncbi:MAG: hypothetical protein SNJ71_06370, partial [Bacteroidales bacterium]
NVSMYILHNTLEETNEFSATHCFLQGLKFRHINDLIINNKKNDKILYKIWKKINKNFNFLILIRILAFY